MNKCNSLRIYFIYAVILRPKKELRKVVICFSQTALRLCFEHSWDLVFSPLFQVLDPVCFTWPCFNNFIWCRLERQTFAITTIKSESVFWTAGSLTTLFCQLVCKMDSPFRILPPIQLTYIFWHTFSPLFLFCVMVYSSNSNKQTGLLFVSNGFCGLGESKVWMKQIF